MEPLFEAKATINQKLTSYNIYRLGVEKYKAALVLAKDDDDDDDNDIEAPNELLVEKRNGAWHSDNNKFADLVSILGVEIDLFNNGYGDILGRIGVR